MKFIDINREGSPPRVRGKGVDVKRRSSDDGITPACAGKRGHLRGLLFLSQDHPRVCGEKILKVISVPYISGSPPRMRGKVLREVVHHAAERITPAYAGKRGSGSLPRSCRRDHPRVCGEKISQTRRNLPLGGSPPRVRGKVRQHLESRQSVGITPACAGKRAAVHFDL